MKKILIAVAVICFATTLNAQNVGTNYKTALGAKVYFEDGEFGGLNIKHFLNSKGALEGSVLFGRASTAVELLYEWHDDIKGAPGLKWYVGGGGLIGFYKERYSDDTYFALRGTVGLDYKVRGAPIVFAFDLNPNLLLSPDTDFNFGAGLAMRFAL